MGNSQLTIKGSNIPVIRLDELFLKKQNALDSLVQSLQQRSYAVLALTDKKQIEEFYSNIECANNFFTQTFETKSNLQQPEGNIGYIHIPEIREFLKYRKSEIESFAAQIKDFDVAKTTQSLNALANICWTSFSALLKSQSQTPLSEQEQSDLKHCLEERASLSIIHYFNAKKNESSESNDPNIKEDFIEDDQKIHVCSKHQDTGIMTIVMTSNVAGLEVFDNLDNKWIAIEEAIQSIRKDREIEILVLMLGQKAPLFLDSQSLYKATIHRVRLPPGIERGSFLYFMDTAKVN